LHLCYGGRPGNSGANAEARDALLAQGRIENSVLSVLILKTNCTSEMIRLNQQLCILNSSKTLQLNSTMLNKSAIDRIL
jgi:hypothetical protein